MGLLIYVLPLPRMLLPALPHPFTIPELARKGQRNPLYALFLQWHGIVQGGWCTSVCLPYHFSQEWHRSKLKNISVSGLHLVESFQMENKDSRN